MAYLLIAAAVLYEDKAQGDPKHRSHTIYIRLVAYSALADKGTSMPSILNVETLYVS
jgi:hypothetical protein